MFRLRVFDLYEKLQFNVIGPALRSTGKRVANMGLALQGDLANDDRLVQSLRCRPFKSQLPDLSKSNFIAPNSAIVGSVTTGNNSSVWYGATLRGDGANIYLGNDSLLQDLTTVFPRNRVETKIGDNVVVGPNSVLESCVIENNSFIGMGATIRQGAKIEAQSVVAAGAVIGENVKVPSNQVWAGNPAQYLRDLTPEEREALSEHHQELLELSKIHAEETEKSFRDVINDEDQREEEVWWDSEEIALKQIKDLGFPMEYEDEDYIEHRVFLKDQGSVSEDQQWKKNYDPYEQDLFNFPDNFKIYGENYEQYESIKRNFAENPEGDAQTANYSSTNNKPWTDKFNM